MTIYTFRGDVNISTGTVPFTFRNVSDDLLLIYDNTEIVCIDSNSIETGASVTISSLPQLTGGTIPVVTDSNGNIRSGLNIPVNALVGSNGTELVPIRAGMGVSIDSFNGTINLAGTDIGAFTSLIINDPTSPGRTEITDTRVFTTDGFGRNVLLDSTVPRIAFQYAFNPTDVRTYEIDAIAANDSVDLAFTYEGAEFFRFFGNPQDNAVFRATALPLVTIPNPTGILVHDDEGNVASTNGPLPPALGGLGIPASSLIPNRILGTTNTGGLQVFSSGTGIDIDSNTGTISTTFNPTNPTFNTIIVDNPNMTGVTMITNNAVVTMNGSGQAIGMNSMIPQLRITDTVNGTPHNFDMRTSEHGNHLDLEFVYDDNVIAELHGSSDTSVPTTLTIPGIPTQTIAGTGIVIHDSVGNIGSVNILPISLGGTGTAATSLVSGRPVGYDGSSFISFEPGENIEYLNGNTIAVTSHPVFSSVDIDTANITNAIITNLTLPSNSQLTAGSFVSTDGPNYFSGTSVFARIEATPAVRIPNLESTILPSPLSGIVVNDIAGNLASIDTIPMSLGGTGRTSPISNNTLLGSNGTDYIEYAEGDNINITNDGNSGIIAVDPNPSFTSITTGNFTSNGTSTFNGPVSFPGGFAGTTTFDAINVTTGPNTISGETTFEDDVDINATLTADAITTTFFTGTNGTFTGTVDANTGAFNTVQITSFASEGVVTNDASGNLSTVPVLPIERGGTARATIIPDNTLLGSNGDDYIAFTQGDNIEIVNNGTIGTIRVNPNPSFGTISAVNSVFTGGIQTASFTSSGPNTFGGESTFTGPLNANGGFTTTSFNAGDVSFDSLTVTTGPNSIGGVSTFDTIETTDISAINGNITTLLGTNADFSGTVRGGFLQAENLNSAGVVINDASGNLGTVPVLPIERGGTGTNSLPANTVLASNGTSVVPLTPGGNLLIDTNAGTIRVSSTPSFTSVNAGSFTGGTYSGSIGTFSGDVQAESFTSTTGPNLFSGSTSVDSLSAVGNISSTSGTITGPNGAFTNLVATNIDNSAGTITSSNVIVNSGVSGYSDIRDTTITTYNADQFVQMDSASANPGIYIQDTNEDGDVRTFSMDTVADDAHIDLRFRYNGLERVRIHGTNNPTTVKIPGLASQLAIAPTRILVTDAAGDVGAGNFAANSYIATTTGGVPFALAPGVNSLVGTDSAGTPSAITVGGGLTLSNGTLSVDFTSVTPTFNDGYNIIDSTPSTYPQTIEDPGTPYYSRMVDLTGLPQGVSTPTVYIETSADYTYQINLQLVRRSGAADDGVQITSWRVRNVNGAITLISTNPQLNRTDGNSNATLTPSGNLAVLSTFFGGHTTMNFEILRVRGF